MTKQIFILRENIITHTSIFNWIEFSIWNVLFWERICWQFYISLMFFSDSLLVKQHEIQAGGRRFFCCSKVLSGQTLPKPTCCSVILSLCLSHPVTSKPNGSFQPKVDVWKKEVPNWKWFEFFFFFWDGFRLEERLFCH